MTIPKVSVLLPIYNMEKYLRRSLDSVVNQTLRDIEIICVDDCSTDSTADILKSYADADERIKAVRLPRNMGTLVARRECIRYATGEYIMWVDPDDYLELYACEELYEKIAEKDVDILGFDVSVFNGGGRYANNYTLGEVSYALCWCA